MSHRIQRKDREYSDLSAKQKGRIAEKTYRLYLSFYLEHKRMPDVEESLAIHKKVFQMVKSLAPNAGYDDFEALCQKRIARYEERIKTDIADGITIEMLHKPKKTPAEKAAIQRAKNAARRKRRKEKKTQTAQFTNVGQDDTFYYIAGYTSGGAPYGVTWEEMEGYI